MDTTFLAIISVERMMIADGLMEQNLAIFLTTAEDRSACHIQKEAVLFKLLSDAKFITHRIRFLHGFVINREF